MIDKIAIATSMLSKKLREIRVSPRPCIFSTLACSSLLLSALVAPASAQVAEGLPTKTETIGGEQEQTVDFDNVTLSALGKFLDSDTLVVTDPRVLKSIGYDVSRSWDTSSLAKDVFTLGDFTSLTQKDLTLNDLGKYYQGDIANIALSEIGPVTQASVGDLTDALGVKQFQVSEVPWLRYFINEPGNSFRDRALNAAEKEALNQLAKIHPSLGKLPLRAIAQGDWKGALNKVAQEGLKELVKNHPVLGDLSYEQIKKGDIKGIAQKQLQGQFEKYVAENATVQQVIDENPWLEEVPISQLANLQNIKVSDVQGLQQIAVNQLDGAAQQSISRIPGAEAVPFTEIFGAATAATLQYAKINFIINDAGGGDTATKNTISGSTAGDIFRPQNCVGGRPKCASVEFISGGFGLSPLSVDGKRWVKGKNQIVAGCKALGCLISREEPTGIKPWNEQPVKFVITEIDEQKDKVDFGVSLQVRWRDPWTGTLHTSAHSFGPFKLITLNRDQPMFISAISDPVSIPTFGSTVPQAVGDTIQTGGGSSTAKPCPEGQTKCSLHNPSPGAVFYTVANVFGASRKRCPGGYCHVGIDLFSPGPSPKIHAIADGTLSHISYTPACGYVLTTKHPELGLKTRNVHARGSFVKAGSSIKRGQVIGREGAPPQGSCGSGVHNHFEIYKGFSTAVNPACYKYDPPMPQRGTSGVSIWSRSRKC